MGKNLSIVAICFLLLLASTNAGQVFDVHAKVLLSLTFRAPYRPHQTLPPSTVKTFGFLFNVSIVSLCQVVEFLMAKDKWHGQKIIVLKSTAAKHFLSHYNFKNFNHHEILIQAVIQYKVRFCHKFNSRDIKSRTANFST
ncbi:hypothetical protein CFP56_020883 [Quercus suber]|uniref:Uncharacterized protein n=1 Tax=Quercus suber TaxID=58331 RepID=A0AAW0KFB0_QUESU